MNIGKKLIEATFLQRKTRFSVLVEVKGERTLAFRRSIGAKEALAYLPNSGRLRELLMAGRKVLLSKVGIRSSLLKKDHRKTRYDLEMVRLGKKLMSIDARLPNKLFQEALEARVLRDFASYRKVDREPFYGQSRLDFLLYGQGVPCYVEVKSVTLVRDGLALCPDAPTLRGRRHLEELIRAKEEGYRAAVVFIVQRSDALTFSPNDETDPSFGDTLRRAVARGVEACAYSCEVSVRAIRLRSKVAVRL